MVGVPSDRLCSVLKHACGPGRRSRLQLDQRPPFRRPMLGGIQRLSILFYTPKIPDVRPHLHIRLDCKQQGTVHECGLNPRVRLVLVVNPGSRRAVGITPPPLQILELQREETRGETHETKPVLGRGGHRHCRVFCDIPDQCECPANRSRRSRSAPPISAAWSPARPDRKPASG